MGRWVYGRDGGVRVTVGKQACRVGVAGSEGDSVFSCRECLDGPVGVCEGPGVRYKVPHFIIGI